MNAKQKIVHGRGPSNINLGIFVFSFDVCQASYPFPSINNGPIGHIRILCIELELACN